MQLTTQIILPCRELGFGLWLSNCANNSSRRDRECLLRLKWITTFSSLNVFPSSELLDAAARVYDVFDWKVVID